MGNIGCGGPRSVVAGRDEARPSKSCFLPVFQYSTIPVLLNWPQFLPTPRVHKNASDLHEKAWKAFAKYGIVIASLD